MTGIAWHNIYWVHIKRRCRKSMSTVWLLHRNYRKAGPKQLVKSSPRAALLIANIYRYFGYIISRQYPSARHSAKGTYLSCMLSRWTRSMTYRFELIKPVRRTIIFNMCSRVNIQVGTEPFLMMSSNGNIFRVSGNCVWKSPVPVNSPHKGQWRGALMSSFIYAWISGSVNNHKAGDLIRHRAHYDVTAVFARSWLGHR